MEKQERDYLFDNLKVLLIFLVVVGHIIENYITKSYIIKSIYTFIYLFHMPLFVFVSGYFAKNLEKSRDRAVMDVLLLYVIFNSFWYLFMAGLNGGSISISFITPGWVLWYLLSLFTWKMLLKDLVRIRFILPISFVIALFAGVFSSVDGKLSLSRTICFLPFFLIGYLIGEKGIMSLKQISKVISFVGICCLAVFAFAINALFKEFNVGFMYYSGPYSSFGIDAFTGVVYREGLYMIAICASIFILALMPSKKFFFSYIGKYTLTIFILHAYIVKILNKQFIGYRLNTVTYVMFIVAPIVLTFALSSKPVVYAFDKFVSLVKRGVFL